MTIGKRLREERTRLGYSQPDFASLIGSTKKTQIEWEADRTSPTAVQLSALSNVGADVLYILTGERGGATSSDERELLALFRSASLAVKAAAVGALQGGSLKTAPSTVAASP